MTERLFVYGTLKPGEERWPMIADLVADAGRATASGTLVATSHGWPAATFDGEDTIHGQLLQPREGAAEELLERCDHIEGEGRLFRRTVIAVEGPDGPVNAVAYEWLGPDQPPGDRVPDGRWTS